jgi:hypothetical protein
MKVKHLSKNNSGVSVRLPGLSNETKLWMLLKKLIKVLSSCGLTTEVNQFAAFVACDLPSIN